MNVVINFDREKAVGIPDRQVVWGHSYSFDPEKDFGPHHFCNNNGTLVLVQRGLVGLQTEDDTIIESPGMVIYIPPHVPHIVTCMGIRSSGIFISLPDGRAPFLLNKVCVFQVSDLLVMLAERIASWGAIEQKSLSQQRLVQTFVDELGEAKETDKICIPFPDHPVLQEVARIIIREPDDMRSLDDWAKFAKMSKRTFMRNFVTDVGLSFGKWRQLIKLQNAIQKLNEGRSVLETAYELGYESPSTLIDIFQKNFGHPPGRYIKSQKEKKNKEFCLDLAAVGPATCLVFGMFWQLIGSNLVEFTATIQFAESAINII